MVGQIVEVSQSVILFLTRKGESGTHYMSLLDGSSVPTSTKTQWRRLPIKPIRIATETIIQSNIFEKIVGLSDSPILTMKSFAYFAVLVIGKAVNFRWRFVFIFFN